MQHYISSTEACAFLDRILQTVQTLNQTRVLLVQAQAWCIETTGTKTRSTAATMEKPGVTPFIEAEPTRPVLTIKLADLVREGATAQARRNQRNRPVRQLNRERQHPRKVQPLREVRTIEVTYKRSQKMAS